MSQTLPFILLIAWFAQAEPGGTDPALRAELEDVARRAAGVKDLAADFEQERFTPLLKKPLVSTGTVLVKGDAMRWETEKPFPSTTLISGDELRIYYPRQKTLEVYPLDRKLGQLAASPVPRLDVLLEKFRVERTPEQPERLLSLRLTPLDEELRRHIGEVLVEVDPETGLAMKAQWSDPSGERTAITFKNLKVNGGVRDDRMDLDVPQGTKVVRPLGGREPGGGKAAP